MSNARDELLDEDQRWQFVTFHDLRRSWAGWLALDDVELGVALRWGGWENLETALNHYRSEATAVAQARERSKVKWL
jgi:integrase